CIVICLASYNGTLLPENRIEGQRRVSAIRPLRLSYPMDASTVMAGQWRGPVRFTSLRERPPLLVFVSSLSSRRARSPPTSGIGGYARSTASGASSCAPPPSPRSCVQGWRRSAPVHTPCVHGGGSPRCDDAAWRGRLPRARRRRDR